MEIRIIEFNKYKKKLIGQHGNRFVYGYWIKFKHKNFEGYSYFVPYGNEEMEEIKEVYSVETSQEEVLNYKLITDHGRNRIEYNEQDEIYKIVGQIDFISDDKEIASMCVFDCNFTFDFNEIPTNEIKLDDWIKVSIKGLTLFDEGIF